ncbi:MAG: DUF3426 domain-containing protein [Candidatus Solibacter usitatus]|nr:DUF3426 domain-containing protein [Candidatus Solibacter usitatus]
MAAKNDAQPVMSLPVILVALLGLVAGGALWYFERTPPATPQGPVLTAEAKAYVRNLKLSDTGMTATESAMHQQLVEISGKITNAGERPLKSVLLSCIFADPYGQVILRERVEIVRARLGGIKPGETKQFRLPFDNLPQSWNQRLPQLVIAEIVFAQ